MGATKSGKSRVSKILTDWLGIDKKHIFCTDKYKTEPIREMDADGNEVVSWEEEECIDWAVLESDMKSLMDSNVRNEK